MLFPLQQLVCLQSYALFYHILMSVAIIHELKNLITSLISEILELILSFLLQPHETKGNRDKNTPRKKLLVYWKYYNLIFINITCIFIIMALFLLELKKSLGEYIFLVLLYGSRTFKRSFDCFCQCYHSVNLASALLACWRVGIAKNSLIFFQFQCSLP